MNTRGQVLSILEENRGKAVSGQELAGRAGVSRAAVWKAVEALRQEGHKIGGATNRGYRLETDSDVLCRETVLPYLKSPANLLVEREMDSTITRLRALALEGAPHGTVALAERQTAGRGRRGRSFASPPGGIYLGVLLRPEMSAQRAIRLTVAACVGVCRAMRATCGLEGGIKWVNDVFLNGRKVCGILTEAATSLENGMLDYAVVGVGVNFRYPEGGFLPALEGIAGCLYGPGQRPPVSRGQMAAALIDSLMDCLSRPEAGDIMAEYRARSMVVGKNVMVLRGEEQRPAQAVDVLEDGSLRVRYADGAYEDLCSGEVSIRPGD